jgi:hypothetical protein
LLDHRDRRNRRSEREWQAALLHESNHPVSP